jgi:hypothetical protein
VSERNHDAPSEPFDGALLPHERKEEIAVSFSEGGNERNESSGVIDRLFDYIRTTISEIATVIFLVNDYK